MDNLTIWAKYAAQNHMTYGQCKVAVQNGLLPPPRGLKKPKRSRPAVLNDSDTDVYRYNKDGTQRKQTSARCQTATCVICGKPFSGHTSRQVTCGSEACKRERLRLYNSRYYQRNGGYNGGDGYGYGICIYCGTLFPKVRTNNVCCSKECSNKSRYFSPEKRARLIEAARAEAERRMAEEDIE